MTLINKRSPFTSFTSLSFALMAAGLVATPIHAQSLFELYQAARTFDASYQSALAQSTATVARGEQAKASVWPVAGLSAGASRTNVDVVNGGSTSYGSQNITLSASQPLYRPSNWASYEQGNRQTAIAQAQLVAAEQDLIIRTSQAYFDVLAAQDTLTFVRAQKAAVAEQLASAKRNFEVGTSTITDTREAQARFDLTTAQEIAAENDLRVKKIALDQLVGKSNTDPKPIATPISLPTITPTDVATWVAQTEMDTPASSKPA